MMDEFEKELSRKILELRTVKQEMELSDVTSGRLIAMEHTLSEYRSFKAKQKPTAPASLVEELREWGNKPKTSVAGWIVWTEGFNAAKKVVLKILSRYEAHKEVAYTTAKPKGHGGQL